MNLFGLLSSVELNFWTHNMEKDSWSMKVYKRRQNFSLKILHRCHKPNFPVNHYLLPHIPPHSSCQHNQWYSDQATRQVWCLQCQSCNAPRMAVASEVLHGIVEILVHCDNTSSGFHLQWTLQAGPCKAEGPCSGGLLRSSAFQAGCRYHPGRSRTNRNQQCDVLEDIEQTGTCLELDARHHGPPQTFH